MANKVIALVYAHDGFFNYDGEATIDAKRGLRRVNQALTEHYGYKVGTKFGDRRGRTPEGDEIRGYALCMETPEDQVPWLIETFWEGGNGGFLEMCNGIGYLNAIKARVRMHALDMSSGDTALQGLLDVLAPGATLPKAKESKPAKPAEDNPFETMGLDELRALLAVAGVEMDEGASREEMLQAYVDACNSTEVDESAEVIPPEPEEVPLAFDVEGKTNKELKDELDRRGIAYKSKDNKDTLISLLS